MSTIGINIKKIRSVKGLNQTDFANLFGLTRANIGSYEELRAEPKIDTIIKIATHYKIPIDKLVRKELTVNEISNFDVFSSIPTPDKGKQQNEVRFIAQADLKHYPKLKQDKKFINTLETARMPGIETKHQTLILFNEGNELLSGNDGFFHGDLLYLEAAEEKLNYFLGVVVDDQKLYKGIISTQKNTITIQPLNSNKKATKIAYIDQLEIWEIKGKFTTELTFESPILSYIKTLDNRLQKIEQLYTKQ